MNTSIDPYLDRDADLARDEERIEAIARFCPPGVVLPLKPSLWDKLRERFDYRPAGTNHSFGLHVVDRTDGTRKVFDWTCDGGMAATVWMVDRMMGEAT